MEINQNHNAAKETAANYRGRILTTPHAILAVAILSTLCFGAVEPWSLAVVGILTAVGFALFAIYWEGLADDTVPKRLFIWGAFIIAYGIFQLVPLPLR